MSTWLVPKKAAQYIKQNNPDTMIKETTLRKLIQDGFPCLKIESRSLIDMDTFERDLKEFVNNSMGKKSQVTVTNGIRKINA